MKSLLGRHDLPRGLRNNNPGNLIMTDIDWQGEIPHSQNTDGHFEQFVELRWGVRAMMKDIIHDINKGKDTLNALIEEYAPPHENDTEAYIGFVSGFTGILPDVQITITKPIVQAIVLAKITLENGSQHAHHVTTQDIADAFAILGIDLPGEVITDEEKKSSNGLWCGPPSPSSEV